jgi:hypothetical protein
MVAWVILSLVPSCVEEVVLVLCAKFDDVGTKRVSTESGCGSAGSLSAGLLFRRDVFYAEEVVGYQCGCGDANVVDAI